MININNTHSTGPENRLGTISSKQFGHGPPVSEGKINNTIHVSYSFLVGLSVKEFTNSDIDNGLRFSLNLKL